MWIKLGAVFLSLISSSKVQSNSEIAPFAHPVSRAMVCLNAPSLRSNDLRYGQFGHDVTRRAIIDVNSIVSGQKYDTLKGIAT